MADYNGDLRLVAHRLDALTKKINDIGEKIDPVCVMVIRHDERIDKNKEEIKTLRKKSDAWNAGNSLGILVAGVLAALGIQR